MRFTRAIILALAIASFGRDGRAGDYDPSDDLFAVFGSKCPSYQGEGASTAFAQAGALKGTIESIAKSDACTGITKALKNIDGLTHGTLGLETRERNRLLQLQDQKGELELALASEDAKGAAADAAYVTELKEALAAKSLQLLDAKSNPSAAVRQIREGTAANLQLYLTQLLDELDRGTACTTQRPSLVAEVGAQALSVASLFASSAVSSLLLTGSHVIDRLVTFIKNRENGKAIRKLSSARLSSAVGCALESLSATYCESRDILTIVRKGAENCPDCAGDHWQGVKLLSNELGSFAKWVGEIRAGSEASGPAQGEEKKQATQVEAELKKLTIGFQAKTNQRRTLHQSGQVTNITEDLRILIDELQRLATTASGESGGGFIGDPDSSAFPLKGFFVEDPRCGAITYFYSKGASKRCPFNPSTHNSCLDCIREFVTTGVPTLAEITKTTNDLIAEGRDIVRRQTSLVQQSNPNLVLATASRNLSNNISPIQFMKNSLVYLRFLEGETSFATGGKRATLLDLKRRIRRSLCIVEDLECEPEEGEPVPPPGAPPAPPPSARTPAENVAELSEKLVPSGDLFYVSNALYTLTQLHVEEKIRDQTIDQRLATIIQLSNLDSLDTLLANFLTKDQKESSAETAKQQSVTNLAVVGDLFENQILQAIRNAPTEKQRAQACLRALALPQAPKLGKQDISKSCGHLVWTSLNSTQAEPIEAKYDELAKLPHEKRVCSLYDVYRRSRLREQKAQSPAYLRKPSGE